MKNKLHSIHLIPLLALLVLAPSPLRAADQQPAATNSATVLQYKVISGYKQPFNDALQLHLSQGWSPVGGVSVTTWNNDLYFAQLISKPAGQ